MSLQKLKNQLERMMEQAREQRSSQCVCHFVEIIEGSITDEQAKILEANRACYEQNHERTHIGFTYDGISPASQGG